jgi:hypothetical protein
VSPAGEHPIMNMGQAAGQAGNSELAVLEKKHPFLEEAGLFFSKNGLFLLKFEPFCKSGGIVFRVQTTPIFSMKQGAVFVPQYRKRNEYLVRKLLWEGRPGGWVGKKKS